MIVRISGDAETDIVEAYWFYEGQAERLGDYFRDCIVSDIESLTFLGGVHETAYGFHRMPAKRFPFAIYYELKGKVVTVVAVLDARRDPSWTRDRLE